MAMITEGNPAESDIKQRGVFRTDDEGRVVQYEFGRLWPDGRHDITYVLRYEYADGRVARTEKQARLGGEFRPIGDSEYSYDADGRAIQQVNHSLDEVTGEFRESTKRFRYDTSGRLVETLQSDSATTYEYDETGNVVREEYALQGSVTLVRNFTYDRSFNPMWGPPPTYYGLIAVSGYGSSPYNLSGWAAQEPGKAPASVSSITYELDERQYPLRRTEIVRNTSGRMTSETVVSEFAYAD